MASSSSSEDEILDWIDDSIIQNTLLVTNRFFDNNEYDVAPPLVEPKTTVNIVQKLINRQIHGRFTRHSRASTERAFKDVYHKCRFRLDQIIASDDDLNHIYMGFTICGQYFLSYTIKSGEPVTQTYNLIIPYEYDLFIWRFVPGQRLQYVSKHRIFKLFKGSLGLDEITFMQFPQDPYKLICYGVAAGNPTMTSLTIMTLPTRNCRNCSRNQSNVEIEQGWCLKHGFMLHFMFSMSNPLPTFNPHVSMAYPDHLVINTGHYLHILNITTWRPTPASVIAAAATTAPDECKPPTHSTYSIADTLSELSESGSDFNSTHSVVDAILDDFSDYDFDVVDHTKPFHELNISCDPLNVAARTYHNALVQNIVDPRLKHWQECVFSVPHTSNNAQKAPSEKSYIDKRIADKAYEFTEENEKCEKISLFRKKRLADKKYEFSEDNSENIVPFYSLRRNRRYFYRSQTTNSSTSLFLSPRSPGLRSPMQSPNSRNGSGGGGQFSPGGGGGGARNLYCPIMRSSPHYCRSPISPRDAARKINVYSPGLDSDCSDSDSRLILRQVHNFTTLNLLDHKLHQSGLLILNPKKEEEEEQQQETPKWIKKMVKRYSSVDFETSSLVSGQSRDDYNNPIEIPSLVQTLTEQHLDIVPEIKADQLSETQLIVTQRTFDCDQFVQSQAQKLCADAQLEFLHCEDYDIKILHICPLNGHIVCRAVIKIGALQCLEPYGKRMPYVGECLFTWNVATNAFAVVEPSDKLKVEREWCAASSVTIPSIVQRRVQVMDHIYQESKKSLRDYKQLYEICMDDGRNYDEFAERDRYEEYSLVSDSD